MSDFTASVHSQLKKLDTKLSGNNALGQLEKTLRLPKSYIVVGASFAYLLLIFVNVGGIGEILSNFIGFIIPTYLSLIALRTPEKKDDEQLLTYWIIFGFLNVIEFWSGAIIYLIPFYWFLKTIFLIYISLPVTGGATLIYKTFIQPISDKYILGKEKTNMAGKASSSFKSNFTSKRGDGIREAVDEASSGRATGASPYQM
ncbi:Yop1p NDAI_0A01360 [Naumovozyma dairenensis CBS 421]|uniref:Protein YOP1 n=1 Tax=Naumovozyma dairenensis (strain ATCC 10597 / BCRC 20456 / CBS 421 / NBRC 0211 / NRRL Y-12639) TaxID=1071378 RepID=G0W3A6_NAUDC|nr:hypothetical protein NDAI_0A01360 [Naumovozyma dairenensis CBS 421]CCD22294.1 hypothetical protein NDAI_0A01360 [Naumovozyma dairenensis CBS 421]